MFLRHLLLLTLSVSTLFGAASQKANFKFTPNSWCTELYYDENLCEKLRRNFDIVMENKQISKQNTKARSKAAADMLEDLTEGKAECWAHMAACARECASKDPKLRRLYLTEAIANHLTNGPLFNATKPYLASLELLHDKPGRTDLHKLIIHNDETLPNLKENEIKKFINAQTEVLGMTPLHYAVILNKINLIHILLGWGADTTIRTSFHDCETAVDLARRLNRPEIFKILRFFDEGFAYHPSTGYFCRALVLGRYLAHKALSLISVGSQDHKEL